MLTNEAQIHTEALHEQDEDLLVEEEPDLSSADDDVEERYAPDLDAESLFAADLAATRVLTRPEEEALARQIATARKRVRAILRRARRVTRAALEDAGRGVVLPEDDFRERETVTILQYAEAAAANVRLARAVGLERKELRAFVTELRAALAEYRLVRDLMLRANVRLVNVLARRYRHPTLSFLDLFQEGTIGLLRAIEKYDPERNIKFSTYATWWIWQQLGRSADTQGSLIRTPVHWNQLRRRVSRDACDMASQNDGPVSREDLAAASGMGQDRLMTMSQAFQFVSTDAPLNDDDDRQLESTLAGDSPEPAEEAEKAALRDHLARALEQLPDRERLILRKRFGWENDDTETLDEIGVQLGVSRERIRQLESRALKRLREVCAAEGLDAYLH